MRSRPPQLPKVPWPNAYRRFIQDREVIQKILKLLDLLLVKPRVPPKANAPRKELEIDWSDSQVPISEKPFHADPDYPIDAYAS